jgi:hypothetical protein
MKQVQIKLLRERYKTAEGARQRAVFENAIALGEFQRGQKARHYRYQTITDAAGFYRVARCLPVDTAS